MLYKRGAKNNKNKRNHDQMNYGRTRGKNVKNDENIQMSTNGISSLPTICDT
jgi:hypothetical protein